MCEQVFARQPHAASRVPHPCRAPCGKGGRPQNPTTGPRVSPIRPASAGSATVGGSMGLQAHESRPENKAALATGLSIMPTKPTTCPAAPCGRLQASETSKSRRRPNPKEIRLRRDGGCPILRVHGLCGHHHDRTRQAERQARIRGLRITVYDVLDYLASGMTEAEILADFPLLRESDIRACLAFAADRERKFEILSA